MSKVLNCISVGKKTLRNRIMIPAHSYCFPNDSTAPDWYEAYAARRLKNGVGAMVLGEAEVVASRGGEYGGGISRRAGVVSSAVYERIATTRDRFGGVVLDQLYSPGGQVWFDENRRAYAPSPVAHSISGVVPNELTVNQITELVDCFSEAAAVAVGCGLDGVELKADQGKLHHQFLSSRYNHRDDEFGLAADNGNLFLLNTLRKLRDEIGVEPILGIRLPGFVTAEAPETLAGKLLPDMSFDSCLSLAVQLSNEGLVDYISISGETNSSLFGYIKNHPSEIVGSLFLERMQELKAAIDIPLVISGGVETIPAADELLRDDCADIAAMARPFIADGDLMAKYTGFDKSLPRRCLYCNIGCIGNTWYGDPVTCSFDPRSGRESVCASHEELARPICPTTIAVVGGGPSGLQFACLAAALGFRVTIFEASENVGGQLVRWMKLDGRQKLAHQIQWWEGECERLGVSIEFDRVIHDLEALQSQFDLVVDARGGHSADCDARDFHASSKALFEVDPEGKEFVIVATSPHYDPIGLAQYLHTRGGQISLVTPHEFVGFGSDPITMGARIGWIKKHKIPVEEFSLVLREGNSVVRIDHLENTISEMSGSVSIVWCTNRVGRSEQHGATVLTVGEAAGFFGVGNVLRSVQDQFEYLARREGR